MLEILTCYMYVCCLQVVFASIWSKEEKSLNVSFHCKYICPKLNMNISKVDLLNSIVHS
jgi:hypothetical protein